MDSSDQVVSLVDFSSNSSKGVVSRFKKYVYQVFGKEISRLSRYCDYVVQIHPRAEDPMFLLDSLDAKSKFVLQKGESLEAGNDLKSKSERGCYVIHGNLNFDFDIQKMFTTLHKGISRASRVSVIAYNPYFAWLFKFAQMTGLRQGNPHTTFLTHKDMVNLAKLSGFEVVRYRPMLFCPFKLLGLGDLLNWFLPMLPFVRNFSLAAHIILRPIKPITSSPKLSVIIPARNEAGNIEGAILRFPKLPGKSEIIFVEGHSSDNTWGEIKRVQEKYKSEYSIKAFQQTGKGKVDAVRLGFAQAEGQLLTILDADLTMPPELLGRFYSAYVEGKGDFVNGSRLLYPMEGKAMRFLNRLGNIFFAKALSYVLETRLTDSLCGTKLLAATDYERMVKWRADFGDVDPFGDFELLFPASILGLGIIDVPIRYRDRTYGSTNISRFKHGAILLKMTLIGLFRIRSGSI